MKQIIKRNKAYKRQKLFVCMLKDFPAIEVSSVYISILNEDFKRHRYYILSHVSDVEINYVVPKVNND